MKVYPVAVVGAGPAGLATALQLKRCGIETLLLESGQPGGLLLNANRVENYPGFPDGISGPELAKLFIQQSAQTGVRITRGRVLSLDFEKRSRQSPGPEGMFSLRTAERVYRALRAVIASGTRPLPLRDLAMPNSLAERVYYDVHPLLSVSGWHIAILGSGDAAFDCALSLAVRNTVTILNRSDKMKCLPLLWERAAAEANIRYKPLTSLVRVSSASSQRLGLECTNPGGAEQMVVDALLAATGREARLDFASPSLLKQMTDLERDGLLFRVGDVKNGLFRQTAIAVGDGILAAMEIRRSLSRTLG